MTLNAICYRADIDWRRVHQPADREIERALQRARRLNRLNGVTGALLLFSDHVLQWIEGEPDSIADTLECATRDRRLTSLEVLASGPLATRLFPHCWLYFGDHRHDSGQRDHEFARLAALGGRRSLEGVGAALAPVSCVLKSAEITYAAMLV
ncbi:BLUF domain-containing protein [Stappia indica]|uniref:BLUF domain-containing protein n=1 Tax=Stappia indica TaxID=538381 RepID=UPI001CD60072|nr:BLUF domain-containing protein [Stappia indica]MCA1297286.1 BLUF domain-containing protein [Stappia indica]